MFNTHTGVGVAGPTAGLPGPTDPPFVPLSGSASSADAQWVPGRVEGNYLVFDEDGIEGPRSLPDSDGFLVGSIEEREFLTEADALADVILDNLPAIREAVVARVPQRDRPNAQFDAINDALMVYLRARRS